MRHIIACILILAGISPVFGGTPTVTNLTDQRFTVSWTTAVAETGWVEYGTTAALGIIAYDARGQGVIDDTHYITIEGLSGTTTYYYKVISGGYNLNSGTITTAAFLPVPVGQGIVGGKVYLQNTTINAEGAIVCSMIKKSNGTDTIGTSAVLSSQATNSDLEWNWSISLVNFRTEDGQQYFEYSQGDKLILWIDAAGDGVASVTVTIGTLTNGILDVGTISLTDIIVPPDISVLQPTPQNGRISLNWDMPVISSGVSGVLILRRQQGYPQATLTSGATYTPGSPIGDSVVVCVSTNTTVWTDESLTNNTTYYYRIFTRDGAYNYSPGIVCQATPVANLDNAAIYPNPWVTGDGAIHFDKLRANTHICIYNIAGELVLEAEAPHGTYSWPPKGMASGIYVYLLKSDDGCVRTGKLGIVR